METKLIDQFINDNKIVLLWVKYESSIANYFPILGKIYQPACYLLNVNNRNTRTKCEICSKLTMKILERRHWDRSGIFIVNFEHISHLVLVFLLLTLNM